jgi:hypothetical protein
MTECIHLHFDKLHLWWDNWIVEEFVATVDQKKDLSVNRENQIESILISDKTSKRRVTDSKYVGCFVSG